MNRWTIKISSCSGMERKQLIRPGLVLINFLTSLTIAAFIHPEIFKVTVPQFLDFLLILVLQLFSL